MMCLCLSPQSLLMPESPTLECLNNLTSDLLGGAVLGVGEAVLCILGYLVKALVSTHYKGFTLSYDNQIFLQIAKCPLRE